jgi:DNA polymerase
MKNAAMKAVLDTVKLMVKDNTPPSEIERYIDDSIKVAEASDVKASLLSCVDCDLRNGNRVPAEGNVNSKIIFVGEGPGEQEDKQQRPFVGPAGQLLDKILEAAGWDRGEIYLTNVAKCRPHVNGKNVQPNAQQIASCVRHLRAEIDMIKPKIVVCLGAVAANTLIHPKFKMTEEHGRWFEIAPGQYAMAIYHPSYLLRKGEGTDEQAEAKAEVWDDIQAVKAKMEELGI